MSLDQPLPIDPEYHLGDCYTRTTGRVFLTGTQALLRATLDQRRRDIAAGLNTAGFVSGYRGSPLGAVDQAFQRQADIVAAHDITFLPAINEDLAATAVLGSQQVETDPDRTVDGVFAMWYGKGPGVDRAGDALKHGNAYGSSPHGGVLVVAGDDHGCVSSSMPHQSDVAFMAHFMPVLNPADVAEFLPFAEYGYALSRFSGMWVGFKAISETVEAGMSVELAPPRRFAAPKVAAPEGGLHYRWPDLPGPQIEERMEAKKAAVLAFARANPIDRAVFDHPDARYGIVTTGKAHLDLMEAMRLLGIDRAAARRIGIDVYKVGMTWPLEHRGALAFARGKQELLIVEEKRGIIESQLKEYFYDTPTQTPDRMVGKRDEAGNRLIPWTGELDARVLARVLAARLRKVFPGLALDTGFLQPDPPAITVPGSPRTPYFCSGCPHSTSTKVPDGSQALAGIGCHFMASWMDRNTTSLIQMGGEGVNWVARSKFNGNRHIFQNLGDGTYYHSGSMAIRQAVAAGTNITYKVLFNDAVAMTGGQNVDGPLSVAAIAHAVRAEGVTRIAVVSDAPDAIRPADFPAGVSIDHRRDLDRVQRELRDVHGVSVLIYQQMCATEKRRRRKRGTLPDPPTFAVINDLVCEGCGDCSAASNCLSVEPVDTPFGRKRGINLAACNKDFSCLDGFCPSFVTVEGATLRRAPQEGAEAALTDLCAGLPAPDQPDLAAPFNLLVTGVGGTGVVTVGQLVAMAAHLDDRAVSVLDFMGFAQKFGPVISYLRIGADDAAVNQARIGATAADAVIGCDLVVSAAAKATATYRRGQTRIMLNTAEMPTGDLARDPDAHLNAGARIAALGSLVGAGNLASFDANRAAQRLLGDGVYANVMLLGAAWQAGLVPVSLAALERAIELNAVATSMNRKALTWGRIAVHAPADFAALIGADTWDRSVDAEVTRRVAFLADYQNAAWARRYADRVAAVRAAEAAVAPGAHDLTLAAATALFKVMSYKDEYEVARLFTTTGFEDRLAGQLDGPIRMRYHLAPPFMPARTDARGRPVKRAFGGWMRWPMRVLAGLRGVRGTALDPFGYQGERRRERALIGTCEAAIDRVLDGLTADNLADRAAILALFQGIRGYGPVKDAAAARTLPEIARRLSRL